jgi:hypothetical protein
LNMTRLGQPADKVPEGQILRDAHARNVRGAGPDPLTPTELPAERSSS